MLISDETGFTLVELLVSSAIALVTLSVALVVLQVTAQNGERVVGKVEASQRVRPAMQTIVNDLHSACIAPRLAPILAGSSDTSIGFLNMTGSAASPVPDRVVVTYSDGTLSRSRYQATGGSIPSWTFASSPYETRQIVDQLSPAYLEDPDDTVPVFRYYAYKKGVLDPKPLKTPLKASDAALTAQVSVGFASSSVSTGERNPAPPVSVINNVTFRFTPATDGVSKENVPCA